MTGERIKEKVRQILGTGRCDDEGRRQAGKEGKENGREA